MNQPSLVLALLFAAAVQAVEPTVHCAAGPLQGERAAAGLCVFRGIPYAAPPVGERRWQPPQPVTPWTEVRAAIAFSPACPQPPRPDARLQAVGHTDEDCLYLNVWTPGLDAAKRPVMVWIHGGGMTIGSGSSSMYDGSVLARQDVVVVTFNYRLGVLGFLAHPELSAESPDGVSGNYGLLDQIAALRWVRDNIAAFGGDPGNVTIFGESAGAVSVGCLLVAPAAKGLFHRAILESGAPVDVTEPLRDGEHSTEAQGLDIARRLKAKTAVDLRAIPAADLVAGCPAAIGPTAKRKDTYKFGPCIDGVVLPDLPLRLFAEGKFHPVPILLGTNRDEMTLFLGRDDKGKPRRKAGLRLLVRSLYKEHADAVLAVFPCARDEDAAFAFRELMTVSCFTSPTRYVARAAAASVPVYLYEFSRVPPGAARSGLGATHGIEIAYVFGTLKEAFGDATDQALAKAMGQCWVAFARTGVPGAPGVPTWPRYAVADDQHMEFGDQATVGTGLRRAQCDAVEPSMRARLKLPQR